MSKVFVSYHWVARSGKHNGFGNYLGEFEEGAYENNPREFILDLEETIANQLYEKLNMEVSVKVLFFR